MLPFHLARHKPRSGAGRERGMILSPCDVPAQPSGSKCWLMAWGRVQDEETCPQEGHMCHQPAWDRDATTLEPSDLEGGAAPQQHKSIKCWRKMGINTIKGGERSQKSFKALSCSPGDHNWHPTARLGAAGRRSCSLGDGRRLLKRRLPVTSGQCCLILIASKYLCQTRELPMR